MTCPGVYQHSTTHDIEVEELKNQAEVECPMNIIDLHPNSLKRRMARTLR